MIDPTTMQTWLKKKGHYRGVTDGKFGPQSMTAVAALTTEYDLPASWPPERKRFAAEQLFLEEEGFDVGDVDGLYGPKSVEAHKAWVAKQREIDPPEPPASPEPEKPAPIGLIRNTWPRQADVPAFYGAVGQNQVLVDVPYKIFYDGKLVKRISLHQKVEASARRIFSAVLAEYGPEKIKELGLDLYCGSLNVRPMRGGTRYSMHSWGIAIDWYCNKNTLNMDHTRAIMAKPAYNRFWEIWEAEGWVSLGRVRDWDWMHVQSAKL